MNKLLQTSFLTMFFLSTVIAQEPADALRYAWLSPSGSARQQAIGGAMGSLGGDISSAHINPAGIAFFKNPEFVFTPGFLMNKNKSTYLGNTTKNSSSNFNYGTSGIIFADVNPYKNSSRKSSALSITINKLADFNSNIIYRGENNQTSYSQKFLEEIRNNNITNPNLVANNFPNGTSLAFNTYWIDTASGGNGQPFTFKSRAPALTGLLQQNHTISSGSMSELALSIANNYSDKFYVGGSLGVPFINYERENTFLEADATTNPNNNFDFASIKETLKTQGAGLNLKLGAIFKPSEYVRLGISLHSPSLMLLTDEYSTTVITDTEGYQGRLNQSSSSSLKYQLANPYRVIVSASYVLREIQDVKKQKGFLTADIEYVNYKASSFSTDESNANDATLKSYFKLLNKAVDNEQKSAFNFRAGGEIKFNTIMGRLGMAYYGNPYKNSTGLKGNRFFVSGGLGYRNKGMFVDLSYVYQINKDAHIPYRLQFSPSPRASFNDRNGNVLMTFGFKI
jgi:hypothetical protein